MWHTWRDLMGGFALGLLIIGGFGVGGWLVWPSEQSRAVCDWAVTELFHSDDSLEIERAGIIIHILDCSVSRRIPKDWTPPDK
jgi:hypothetical protein